MPGDSPSAVTCSAPSAGAHGFPVVSVTAGSLGGGFHGDAGADGGAMLCSVSSDGRVCEWDTRRLAAPLRSFVLRKHGGGGGSHAAPAAGLRPCAVACAPGVPHSWFVGEEDGGLSWGDVGSLSPPDASAPGAAGIATLAGYASPSGGGAHASAVCGVSAHPHPDCELLLTSSFDGSVRLWAAKGHRMAPLLTLDSAGSAGNYVADVGWSPSHPCVFASVDTGAGLRLWHLGRDDRAPALVRQVAAVPQPQGAAAASAPGYGLARLRWSPDGRSLAVGDLAGMAHVIQLSGEFVGRGGAGAGSLNAATAFDEEEMAVLRAKTQEWTELAGMG